MLENFIKKIFRPFYKSFSFYKELEKLRAVPNEFASLEISQKEIERLKSLGQQTGTSELFGKPVQLDNAYWYAHSLRELFIDEIYKFDTNNPRPYIIDCGANIGLSVIHFKRQYPDAKIVAFEPDPNVFKILVTNVRAFGLSNITCQQKAIWMDDGILNFAALGAVSGKIDINGSAAENTVIPTPSVRLKNLLNEKVDFLKMDIEGAEFDVINDCKDSLLNVENLFVEYHSEQNEIQMLPELLSIFKNAGFRIYIKDAHNNYPHPFARKNYNPFFDLQLNIFGYRN